MKGGRPVGHWLQAAAGLAWTLLYRRRWSILWPTLSPGAVWSRPLLVYAPCTIRAHHAHYKNKNIAYDPQLRPVGPLCGAPGYPQAVRHGNGGRTHAPALPGLAVADAVHANQRSGLRRFALEPATLFPGQRLAGLVAVTGGAASDSGRGLRFGDSQPSGPSSLDSHVFTGFGHDRPDPRRCRHCPGARGHLHPASLGVRPDRRRRSLGQRGLRGQPAGISLLYLALPVAAHRLYVLGR